MLALVEEWISRICYYCSNQIWMSGSLSHIMDGNFFFKCYFFLFDLKYCYASWKWYLNLKSELISHWELLIQAIKIFLSTCLVKFEAKMKILNLLAVKKQGSWTILMKAFSTKLKALPITMRCHWKLTKPL